MRERQIGQDCSRERSRPAHSTHTHTWPHGRSAAERSRSIHTQHRRDSVLASAAAAVAVAVSVAAVGEVAAGVGRLAFEAGGLTPSSEEQLLCEGGPLEATATGTASGGLRGARRRGSKIEGAAVPAVKAPLRRGIGGSWRRASIAASFRSVI